MSVQTRRMAMATTMPRQASDFSNPQRKTIAAYTKITKPNIHQSHTTNPSLQTRKRKAYDSDEDTEDEKTISGDKKRTHTFAQPSINDALRTPPPEDKKPEPEFVTPVRPKRKRADETPSPKIKHEPATIFALPQTPERSAKRNKMRVVEPETPTSGARVSLESFVLKSPRPIKFDVTKPADYAIKEEAAEILDMYNAFLKALALHIAHSGANTPTFYSQLKPSIAQSWGRRTISDEDIALAAGLTNSIGLQLNLTLHAISKDNTRLEIHGLERSSLDTRTLQQEAMNLIRKASNAFTGTSATAFRESLPHCTVEKFVSSKVAQNTRGKQLLRDMLSRTNSNSGKDASPKQSEQKADPKTRSTSLMDRVLAREAEAASQSPMTKAQTERIAALQRIPETIAVITSLVTQSSSTTLSASSELSPKGAELASLLGMGGLPSISRVLLGANPHAKPLSVSMPHLRMRLQDSFRHAVSESELEKCIELMCEEVTPGWISIRKIGKVVAVVVRGQVGEENEWRERLRVALEKKD